jgi:hypothetical protein
MSDVLARWFESGRAIDFILVVVVAETLALHLLRMRTGRGLPLVDVIGQLSAGFFLLLAVRCALVDAAWHWTAVFLTLSLPAHAIDLRRRWRAFVARR